MNDEMNGHEPSEDELRGLLRSIDPMHPGVATPPPSRERLEDFMAIAPTHERPTRSRWLPVAAAAVIAVGIGVVAAIGGGSSAPPTTVAAAGPPLQLKLPGSDPMAMCIQFDVEFLAEMPIAFEGTVTSVEGDQITVSVDHWYRGGEAPLVEMTATQGMQALIGGIEFIAGEQYLITATDGNVNYCGFSGPATPELRTAFDQAFKS